MTIEQMYLLAVLENLDSQLRSLLTILASYEDADTERYAFTILAERDDAFRDFLLSVGLKEPQTNE